MKARQIDKVLRALLVDLAETHKPIADELEHHTVITGGCIASMLLKEPVNDYDIYFTSQRALVKVLDYFKGLVGDAIDGVVVTRGVGSSAPDIGPVLENPPRHLYDRAIFTRTAAQWLEYVDNGSIEYMGLFMAGAGQWSQSKENVAENQKYWPIFASQNALTLTDKVQLVFRFTGPANVIHQNYDFVHATNYFTMGEGLVLNTDACAALLARELVYKGSRYPLASIFRTRKFIKRGWNIHIGNYVKMAMQLNSLDLRHLPTLRDQLTGVDAAYLNWIIQKCQKAGAVTEDYVCELVDKIISGRGEGDFEEDFEPDGYGGDEE